jgi:hypothetical protein
MFKRPRLRGVHLGQYGAPLEGASGWSPDGFATNYLISAPSHERLGRSGSDASGADRSEPGAEVRTRHGREYVLLVVDGSAAVGGHVGWMAGRDEQLVDVAPGIASPK